MAQDYLLRQLREALLRLTQTPQRATEVKLESEEQIRQSVRHLARTRVSALLRQLRAARGYSYEEVSERTGLSQQLLFDVEYKDRRLTLDELRLLATCYQVQVEDILGIDLAERRPRAVDPDE
ncbi:MAG: hypothetical protein KatS3mg050_4450 [Litorilinea sp.]|nr:MAG: hypothetical protein KatS3mg050_4450 [Litorilinea sp.]